MDGPVTDRRVGKINAYLVDGPNVFITKRSAPLVRGLPEATFGNMPRDEGHLIVTANEYEGVSADPIARAYLRPFIGGEELLHGKERWCLWLTDLNPADLERSAILHERIEAVRRFRLLSAAASTRQMASTPHLFGQRPALYERPYLIIPRHVSESREYFLAARYAPEVICADSNFSAADPDGLMFALISSSMFMAWQSTVGGRLESRLRFSNTIVWNNLPLPDLDGNTRSDLIAAGRIVEEARAAHPDLTLHELYRPEAMPGDLREAHRGLDALVDKAFGARAGTSSLAERQHVLFQRYEELTAPLMTSLGRTRGRR